LKAAKAKDGLKAFFAFAFFVAVMIALFHRVLFGHESFFLRDIGRYYIPMWKFGADSLARGTLPFWNPFNCFGHPFLANPESCFFYLPNLLFLASDSVRMFNVYVVLHLASAGFFMFLWCRHLGLSHSGALLSGSAYALSGYLLAATNLTISLSGAAVFPLTLLLFDRGIVGGRGACLGAALALILQLLTGDPAIFYIGSLAGLFFLTERAWGSGVIERGHVFKNALFILLLFVGLAAFVWIPFAEWIGHSSRHEQSFAEATRWSVWPSDLAGLVIPFFKDLKVPLLDYQSRQSWLDTIYAGATPVVLALATLVFARTRRAWMLAGLAVLSILVSLGRFVPLYAILYRIFPGFSLLRYPVRFLFLFFFAVAVLAGMGFDSIGRGGKKENARTEGFMVALGFVAAVFLTSAIVIGMFPGAISGVFAHLASSPEVSAKTLEPFWMQTAWNLRRSLIFASAALLGIVVFRSGRARAFLAPFFFIPILVTDLVGANPMEPTIEAHHLVSISENERLILLDKSLFRVTSSPKTMLGIDVPQIVPGDYSRELYEMKEGLVSNYPLHLRFYDALGYDSLYVEDVNKVLIRLMKAKEPGPLLDLLNIKYFVSPSERLPSAYELIRQKKGANLYLNTHVLPRAFIVDKARVEKDRSRILDAICEASFSPASDLYIEKDQGSAPPVSLETKWVQFIDYQPNRVRLSVRSGGGWLFLSDAFFPSWVCKLDGRRVPIYRANYAFRAVKLASGRHEVEWIYIPISFWIGSGISLMAFIGALLWIRAGRKDGSIKKKGHKVVFF